MKPGDKIIFNTGVLYVRLLIGIGIGLFTTRLVLGALGETDFGIYTLVAGVVGMLGILNSSMSNAAMRFMAHSLGTDNEDTIRKTFNTTLFLHFVIGFFIVIIMEVAGLLMFEYLLNIPEGKLIDAKIVFHFMVLTTFITIISVPYDAVINAHENILALSLVDILIYVLKLATAIYLTKSDANLLVLYGLLMLLIQILSRIIKQWYSRSRYQECKINFRAYTDKELSKRILSFSGWNLLGSISAISVTQVRGILLNMFFGVLLNSADGISRKASDQVNLVSVNMTRALNPQLVKSEGSGNRSRVLRLNEIATKFSVYLFAIFAIPVIFEANYLLNLWLKVVPEFSVIFCQLILIGLFIDKFTFEIGTTIRAVGKIRNFQIAETIPILFNIPITYAVFKMGYPPYSIFFVNIFMALIAACVRLSFGKRVAGMDVYSFLKNGVLPVLFPLFLATLAASIPQFLVEESFLRLCITTISFLLMITTSFWFLGLNEDESKKIKQIVYSVVQKVKLLKMNPH